MSAPLQAIVWLIGPDWSKGSKPPPRRPATPRPAPWRPQRSIPSWDKEALHRRVEEMRRATRAQVEAMRLAGRAMLRAA
jgi:hypothetical protein